MATSAAIDRAAYHSATLEFDVSTYCTEVATVPTEAGATFWRKVKALILHHHNVWTHNAADLNYKVSVTEFYRMPLENYLDASEAAGRLGIHTETVRRLCRQGDLPAEKLGNSWLIDSGVLGAFAKRYNPNRGARTSSLSHISLFTGAGGLDLGVERSGFTTLVAVEKNRHAQNTLHNNRRHFRYPDFALLGDAYEVSDADLLNAAGVRKRELDLLSGGAPCQSFSTAGRRKSASDPNGGLIERFLELVGELQPRFFLLENVRGILSAALRHRPLDERGPGYPPLDPEEELGSFLDLFVWPFIRDRLGYDLSMGLLNAADYGVPQVRQRVIFIGSRDYELRQDGEVMSTNQLVRPTHAEERYGGLKAWRSLEDALDGRQTDQSEGAKYSPARAEVLDKVPAGKNWRFLRDEFGEGYLKSVMGGAYESTGGKVGFWRRLSFSNPCPTLPASPIQKATSLCHPAETRPLNVSEYACVQQFPGDYIFAGPVSAKYAQIGNAVPVGLAQAVGQAIAAACRRDNCPSTLGKRAGRSGEPLTA